MTNFCVHSQVGVSVVDSGGAVRPCCKFSNTIDLPTIFDIESLDGLQVVLKVEEFGQISFMDSIIYSNQPLYKI